MAAIGRIVFLLLYIYCGSAAPEDFIWLSPAQGPVNPLTQRHVYTLDQTIEFMKWIYHPEGNDVGQIFRFQEAYSVHIYRDLMHSTAYWFKPWRDVHQHDPMLRYGTREFWLPGFPGIEGQESIYCPWSVYKGCMSAGNASMFLYLLASNSAAAFYFTLIIGHAKVKRRELHMTYGTILNHLCSRVYTGLSLYEAAQRAFNFTRGVRLCEDLCEAHAQGRLCEEEGFCCSLHHNLKPTSAKQQELWSYVKARTVVSFRELLFTCGLSTVGLVNETESLCDLWGLSLRRRR